MVISEIQLSTAILWLLQALLVPFQFAHLLLRIKDKSRIRFVFISSLFFLTCSSLLFTDAGNATDKTNLSGLTALLIGNTTCYYYYYFGTELSIAIWSRMFRFLVTFCMAGPIIYQMTPSSLYFPIGLVSSILSFLFSVYFLILFLRNRNSRTPMSYAGIIGVFSIPFLPMAFYGRPFDVWQQVAVCFPYYCVLFAYTFYYIKQAKIENKFLSFLGSSFDQPLGVRILDNADNLLAYDLTPRELEIAIYMLNGKSYQEIADYFYLSYGGLSKHTSNIYKKVGIKKLPRTNRQTQFIKKFGENREG